MQMYSYGVIVILTVVYYVQPFAVQLYVPRLYLYSDCYHTNVIHHILEILLWTYWLLCFCCCQQCYYGNCLKQIKRVICLPLNAFTLTNPRQHSYSFQSYCNCTMNYNDKQCMSVYVLIICIHHSVSWLCFAWHFECKPQLNKARQIHAHISRDVLSLS